MKYLLILLLCAAVCLVGCSEIPYYRTESSEPYSEPEVSDPTPPYVCGETGFYDTNADVQFLLQPGVYAKERGDVLFTDARYTIYTIQGAHESYLLCDGENRVFRNESMPWAGTPGDDEWVSAYPALEVRD